MSKPEWGVKRLCPSCNALYYDMGKLPPTCPKCSTVYDPEALLKSRRKMVAEESKKKQAVAPLPEEEVEEIEVEETEADVVAPDDLEDDALEVEVEVDTDPDKDL